jgi:hypothetical protein
MNTMISLRDASLKVTRALPSGAATVTSTAIDTGKTTALGNQSGAVEYLLSAPALAVGELANGSTMTYNILWSDAAALSAPTTHIAAAIVQTGAGGAGATAATYRFRLPSTAGRYIFITAVNSAAADASAKSATLEALF